MTIAIETYQIMIWSVLGAFISILINDVLGGPQLIHSMLTTLIFGAGFYGALVALTNLKSKEVKAYWKKENKFLIIPLYPGKRMLAYDEEGQLYKLGIFFVPKKTSS